MVSPSWVWANSTSRLSQRGVVWSKCILDPLAFQIAVTLDTDNVKSNNVIRILLATGQKKRCCADNLALFVLVNGCSGHAEARAAAVPNLDKNEVIAVQHDEVNLTASSLEIVGYQPESLANKETIRELLGLVS